MQKIFNPRLVPALMAIAFSGSASAAGFQLLEQNASGLGNAYAGSAAVADNASTIYFNPAGMTQLQDREVSMGGTLVKTSFDFKDNGSSVGTLAGSGNGNDGGTLGFIPNAYMSWALSKDVYIGLGMGAPFGMKTEYDDDWVGAAHSISFEIKTINLNPSIAWRANEWLSLGFGLNWQRVEAEYVRKVATGVVGVPPFNAFPASTVKLTLDDDSWGWNAGALFKLAPQTKLGVSYRSSVKYDTKGKTETSGPSSALNTAGSVDAKAEIKMPDTFIVSLAHGLNDRVELLGDVSWTGWSSIPKVDIVRASGAASGTIAQVLETDFRDTWRVAVGTNYKIDETLKLKFGLAYDQTPVKDAEYCLTSMPDNNRTWFSAGAQWKLNKTTAIDVGAAYLYLKDAEINNNQSQTAMTAAAQSTNRGTVKGTYDDSAWILGAQFSMAF